MQRQILLVVVLATWTLRAASDGSGQRTVQALLAGVREEPESAHVSIDAGTASRIAMPPQFRSQQANDARPSSGNARIRGRVLVGGSVSPARRASVWLSSPKLREPRTVTTDMDGRYEFANLPPGQYSLSASKSGFLGLSYGQAGPLLPARTLELRERQVVEDVDLLVVRGGAISGRVLDEFGDSMANVAVTVLQSRFQQGRLRLVASAARASTNDLGEYRIFGLPPGSYYVSAALPPGPPPVENGVQLLGEDPGGLAPMFYPGTSDLGTAAKINLTAGQTASGVDMVLVAARLARVSGTAKNRQGLAMSSGTVNAIPRGMAQNGFARSAPLGLNGQFRLTGLPPGEYLLIASSRVEPLPDRSRGVVARPDVATATVFVTGDDVDGVFLVPLEPVTLSGHVIFDDSASATVLSPSAIRLTAAVLNPDDAMAGLIPPPATLRDDFHFVMQVPAIPIILGATATAGVGTSWTVKAVYVNGVDVADIGIDLGAGRDVSGIEIELTDGGPQVAGTVTFANAPVAGYAVILFPQDPKWRAMAGAGLFQLTRTDASGRFSMKGLRPGRYYAVALSEVDELAWTDPAFLEGAARHATAFSLAHGERKVLFLSPQSP